MAQPSLQCQGSWQHPRVPMWWGATGDRTKSWSCGRVLCHSKCSRMEDRLLMYVTQHGGGVPTHKCTLGSLWFPLVWPLLLWPIRHMTSGCFEIGQASPKQWLVRFSCGPHTCLGGTLQDPVPPWPSWCASGVWSPTPGPQATQVLHCPLPPGQHWYYVVPCLLGSTGTVWSPAS